jgi:hypothetical protein
VRCVVVGVVEVQRWSSAGLQMSWDVVGVGVPA